MRRFQVLVEGCGRSEPDVSRTVVYFRRERVFAGVPSSTAARLEVVIDLLRTAEHQCLFGSFASTKQVASHRLRISEADQLDAAVEALLREAYETVGPGTRNLH